MCDIFYNHWRIASIKQKLLFYPCKPCFLSIFHFSQINTIVCRLQLWFVFKFYNNVMYYMVNDSDTELHKWQILLNVWSVKVAWGYCTITTHFVVLHCLYVCTKICQNEDTRECVFYFKCTHHHSSKTLAFDCWKTLRSACIKFKDIIKIALLYQYCAIKTTHRHKYMCTKQLPKRN